MAVDGPLERLKARGFSVSGLARAERLDANHLHNALRGRSTLRPDELVALTAALDAPVVEVLPPAMLERALGR